MSIEVKGLTKVYGNQKAIDNISFIVNKGEIVGFLGPNGAGKSTTMKIITGFLTTDTGEAFVTGQRVNPGKISTKGKIGYLPEANPLYQDMYVREYLEFIFDVHQLKNDKNKRIDEVISLTGLTIEQNKKIGQLSKGYRQRVGLAAALIHDPEVLILDEPTSGLDPNQIVEIREVIKKLGNDKTVLFSSHILQEVEAICDRVIIINKGIIVADDKLSKLQRTDKKTNIVFVEFEEDIDVTELQKMNDVDTVESVSANKKLKHYKLHTSNPEFVRRQLMELSLRQNYNIISLKSETLSLESIFRSLTSEQ